jgi:hypothetical protein
MRLGATVKKKEKKEKRKKIAILKLQLKTIDTVNPPVNLRLLSDQALVSLRTSIVDNNALKYILKLVGGVFEHVPTTYTL